MSEYREGSLEAPTRHPIDWKNPEFFDEALLNQELERVFNICHGCRRCVSLCHAFPTMFDLIDESDTMEVDGVDRDDYGKVVEHCYLCDLCYMTKCPYVPPHEWNVDFPHLMLRAKSVDFKKGKTKLRDRILTSTDQVGSLAGIPVVADVVNTVNNNRVARKVMDKTMGIHPNAVLPDFHSQTARKKIRLSGNAEARPDTVTHGKVAVFTTCYGNRNAPDMVEDMVAVFEHNDIPVRLVAQEKCCGMPKLELGDLQTVEKQKNFNIPQLLALINEGWDIIAPIPSCVLMFKQELPLLFPEDENVSKVRQGIYDPFEYLMYRHKAGLLKTGFKQTLGRVAYHAPCHQRVQNIGLKTRDVLQLVPDTQFEVIERCSGHDGTYAVKSESHEISMKICRPVTSRVEQFEPDHFISDCPMAGHQIQHGMKVSHMVAENPFKLLRYSYGI